MQYENLQSTQQDHISWHLYRQQHSFLASQLQFAPENQEEI